MACGGFTDGGLELARAVGLQLHHPATGAQGCPPLLGGEGQQQVEACIVELPVAVGHAALTRLQQRQGLTHLLLGQQSAMADASLAGQGVVHPQTKSVVGLSPELLCGQGQLESLGQERCLGQPVAPFEQGFPHQPQLGQVQSFKGQLQIAHPAMEQLRAAATGATADVSGLEQGHAQPPSCCLIGHAGTAGTGADDQQVHLVISHATPGFWRRRLASVCASGRGGMHPSAGGTIPLRPSVRSRAAPGR